MSTYIPVDDTPSVPGFDEVPTRIIFGRWIYTDGTPVIPPPTISYVNAPYFVADVKANIFAKTAFAATALTPPTDEGGNPIPGTTGIWYAEVITRDPELVGDVAVKISHSALPGGQLTISVPDGAIPLNIADAELVVGSNGSMVAVSGAMGPTGLTGPPGAPGATGPGLDIRGTVDSAYQMPTNAEPGQAFITDDDKHLHVWDSSSNGFVDVGSFTGPAGPVGPQGDPGVEGAQGPIGPQGNPGPTGAQGIQGVPGPQGDKGDQGDQGIQGTQGNPGLPGPTGPQGDVGPQGDPGTSIQLVGAVTDFNSLPTDLTAADAEKTYVAQDTGHAWAWDGDSFIDLGQFRGPVGDPGPAGEAGPVGPQGIQGDLGPQGVEGPVGPVGPKGDPGEDGPQGVPGIQGQPGATGPAGPAGTFIQNAILFSQLTGATDDAKLAAGITAYQSSTLKGRTIFLDENRDYTFTTQVTLPSGFSLMGQFRPVDQPRSSLPVANRVVLRMSGASAGKGLFKIAAGNTYGCSFANLSIDADASSSLIDGSEDNGGVLWTSTFRDISMQNGKSVIGYTGNKLLVTAVTLGGFWVINNIRDCAWNIGGSDLLANPEMMLVDSPPELLNFNQTLMKFNGMTNMHWKGVYCTAEGHSGLVFDGSNATSTALWFEDSPAIEGRNANQPSVGALVRINAGQVMIRGTRFGFGMANPSLITTRTDKGIIHVAGGNVQITDSVYERGNTVTAWSPPTAPTVGGEVTEDVPFVYVAAGAKVRVRNIVGIGPLSGARSWVGKPVVKQAVAGSADVDSSVTLVTATVAAAPNASGDTTTGFANAATSVTINKPANVVTGDLLIAAVYNRNSTTAFSTPPTGWTTVAPANGDNASVGVVRFYYKNITNGAGEPVSYTWAGGASGRNVGVITRVTGAINTSPLDVAGNNDILVTNPYQITLPSFTAAADLDLLVMMGVANSTGGVSAAPFTVPDGGTVVTSVSTNTGASESGMTLAVQSAIPIGVTGTRRMVAAGTSASSGVGYMLGIKSVG